VLNAHPGVVQFALIGRSVEGNEEVVAFAQLLPGSPVTVTELAEHAARHLAPYKRQSQILIVSAIPLTPRGKLSRLSLRRWANTTVPSRGDDSTGSHPLAAFGFAPARPAS